MKTMAFIAKLKTFYCLRACGNCKHNKRQEKRTKKLDVTNKFFSEINTINLCCRTKCYLFSLHKKFSPIIFQLHSVSLSLTSASIVCAFCSVVAGCTMQRSFMLLYGLRSLPKNNNICRCKHEVSLSSISTIRKHVTDKYK